MGNTLNYVMSSNNDWFVYKRLKNNKYSKEPEQTWRNISKETAINRFKHEIMAYVLNKYEYTDTKAIYLYNRPGDGIYTVRCSPSSVD